MSKEKIIHLAAAESLEVAKDLMFCVVADDVQLSSHRLGQCVQSLEQIRYRLRTSVLEQKDVMTSQDAEEVIKSLRQQISMMTVAAERAAAAARDKVQLRVHYHLEKAGWIPGDVSQLFAPQPGEEPSS